MHLVDSDDNGIGVGDSTLLKGDAFGKRVNKSYCNDHYKYYKVKLFDSREHGRNVYFYNPQRFVRFCPS